MHRLQTRKKLPTQNRTNPQPKTNTRPHKRPTQVDKHGRRIRYIRSEANAKFIPGDPKRYIPFAPNWIVKGHIARENGILKFDFDNIITIKGYDIFINDEDE